ncbi:unnamed protein product [Caenorhabditis auriculariae]|uniref:Uncharacterized protein n=1 Tax=Caenorhabditis auriculariae TaxID=2777116 RepID=A0A8S1HCH4_9PELO|nr:unnamed protein product [Caenorhabditis auriculariae]
MNLHEEDLKQNGYQGDENCAVNDERLREVPGTPEEGVKQHNANNESVVPKKTEETWDEFIDRVFPDLPPVRVQYVTWDQFLPTLHNNPKIRKFVPPSRQFRVAEPKYTVSGLVENGQHLEYLPGICDYDRRTFNDQQFWSVGQVQVDGYDEPNGPMGNGLHLQYLVENGGAFNDPNYWGVEQVQVDGYDEPDTRMNNALYRMANDLAVQFNDYEEPRFGEGLVQEYPEYFVEDRQSVEVEEYFVSGDHFESHINMALNRGDFQDGMDPFWTYERARQYCNYCEECWRQEALAAWASSEIPRHNIPRRHAQERADSMSNLVEQLENLRLESPNLDEQSEEAAEPEEQEEDLEFDEDPDGFYSRLLEDDD